MFKDLKSNFKTYFSNGPKAVFVIVLLILSIAMTTHSLKKTVLVVIDGKQEKIITYKSNLKEVLVNNNILVGPKDKITPSLDSTIKDGQIIDIKKAVEIEVVHDGKKVKIKSAENDVISMLKTENIALSDIDKISPSKETVLSKGLKVVITRVDSKVFAESKPIDFQVVTTKNDEMGQDQSKVIQAGSKGEKVVTTQIIYEDGKEVSKKTSEKILKAPIKKIVQVGTLGVLVPSRGGKVYYKTCIRARATGYTSDYNSTGKSPGDYGFGITATGTVAKRSSSGYSSIAVDPRVIPLGTKLYIPGYGYGIAEDTGGGIKGSSVDLYFNSNGEALNWGVRWVDVYILK